MIAWINKKRNKKGFTLIELIVVIAILGILAALAVPRLTGSRDRANRSAVVANLRTIESALSIAEAEGVIIKGRTEEVDEGETIEVSGLEDLADKNYLSAVPTGPGGATYNIGTTEGQEGRAVVTLVENNTFEFYILSEDGTSTSEATHGTQYTLDQLTEEPIPAG